MFFIFTIGVFCLKHHIVAATRAFIYSFSPTSLRAPTTASSPHKVYFSKTSFAMPISRSSFVPAQKLAVIAAANKPALPLPAKISKPSF